LFPFQGLQGSIPKEDAFRAEHSDIADHRKFGPANATSIAAPAALGGVDAESEEWSISLEESRGSTGVSTTRIV